MVGFGTNKKNLLKVISTRRKLDRLGNIEKGCQLAASFFAVTELKSAKNTKRRLNGSSNAFKKAIIITKILCGDG